MSILDTIISRTPIHRGWSPDKKYRVTAADGTPYLLRVSPPEKYETLRLGFDMMTKASALGVPMCRPVDLALTDEGTLFIQEWIDGDDFRDIAHTLTDAQKREYGRESGRILRLIHSIPAPESTERWDTRYDRKIDRKLNMYRACPLKYDNGECIVDYVINNRHLIKNRPQTYQHGDYHTGNMMLDRDGGLRIIDFGSYSFGDPWEEFNRIVWCVADASPAFAAEMINAYFDGSVPDEFWPLLALYVLTNLLSSLPWAIPFGEGEIATMRAQAEAVLGSYNDMTDPVPNWFRREVQ